MPVKNQQKQTAKQIHDTDGGNHALTQTADLAYSTQNDKSCQEGKEDTGDMRRQTERAVGRLRRRVGLRGTADAEGGDQGAESVDAAEKGIVKPIL